MTILDLDNSMSSSHCSVSSMNLTMISFLIFLFCFVVLSFLIYMILCSNKKQNESSRSPIPEPNGNARALFRSGSDDLCFLFSVDLSTIGSYRRKGLNKNEKRPIRKV